MNYRKLGNTGILASEIGMGSEGLVGMAREDAIRLISAALEGGVNYFDLYNPSPRCGKISGAPLRRAALTSIFRGISTRPGLTGNMCAPAMQR